MQALGLAEAAAIDMCEAVKGRIFVRVQQVPQIRLSGKESKARTADGALGLADAAAIDMCEGVKGWQAAPTVSVFVLLY
jgi:hypothetical protein